MATTGNGGGSYGGAHGPWGPAVGRATVPAPIRPEHRPRRRGRSAGVLVVVIAVAAAVTVLVAPWAATAPAASGREPGGAAAGSGSAVVDANREPRGTKAKAKPKAKAAVVQRGDGSFEPARGGSDRAGAGDPLRYRVEVENGIGQEPDEFARWVDTILADPRGWTADGRRSFERVPTGSTDFVVRLASPDTVDSICGRYGLDTFGEVSCRAGKDVVINLRRWLLAVPGFDGDVAMYRHAVVNHEVGHFLGFKHRKCPGEGEPMPVMGTPYYGLDGCRPNGWPYPDRR